MGLPQMMGFNYKILGYSSEKEMFEAFNTSAHAQILGMFDFIKGTPMNQPMLKALTANKTLNDMNAKSFARHYNGSGKAEEYGNLIYSRYQTIKRLNLANNILQ